MVRFKEREPLDFLDAVNGARKAIQLRDGGALDVAIPAAAPSGDAVPVVITLNEIQSNVATIAIE